jgi:hypothetical protein
VVRAMRRRHGVQAQSEERGAERLPRW